MHVHEDKTPIDATKKGGRLAKGGRRDSKVYANKKADRFKKAKLKRG